MLRKIVKVEEPAANDGSYRGGLFNVWYENADGCCVGPCCMFEAEYQVVKFEDILFRKGLDPILITQYRQLIEAYCRDEEIERELEE